jgi:exodeoxyribonuclease V gamma subunit
MPTTITPGFVSLHGNQLEQLRSAVIDWIKRNPLAPLENEIFLVQSNGVAEWLKIALAEEIGICAATRITLPARFTWETYRGVLGHEEIKKTSAFDRSALVWRLMQLLPTLLNEEVFLPLRYFLHDGQAERRLQLAQRLADLMDQYQVYRVDWLSDWAAGHDVIKTAQGTVIALPPDQLWQAYLWRALNQTVDRQGRENGRVDVHQRFLSAMAAGVPDGQVPRRVVLFGVSALPYQTMQVLGALAKQTQVLLAVPNPSQFYWGDIVPGNSLLTATRHRQNQKTVAAEMTEISGGHPLLASWGRQGRDFIRMLDEFDDVDASRMKFSNLRVDLFSEGEGNNLLEQVQAAVRDILPIEEHPKCPPTSGDRSIEFHVAHSVQREVEVLYDQLLMQLATKSGAPLRPRDIVVMVPDMENFMPAIRAVFGQYQRNDPRFIPFEIADIKERTVNPLLVALEWLLRLPSQRCLQSEICDLLNVPALAARFGLKETDLPQVISWIQDVGIRWGLDTTHREGLSLGAVGEQNTWLFGIRRMMLGYASGADAEFGGIEPYPEIAGLDASLAGSLAHLVETLMQWRTKLASSVTPEAWGISARGLLQAFFTTQDERDRLTVSLLEESLQRWLRNCDEADYQEVLPLSVLREAWLGPIDEPNLHQRFVSGGVTFCTLMPMRAVPFRVVCLLGMNDGDFPRRAQHADFDLLALPGMARPGDRSRRDDDRYLMLEALLAARDKLYISWVGRSVRDNSEQPPSILVSQLRDYLVAGWNLSLDDLTFEHPLQPFSRKYFEQGSLLTYAREWRSAHATHDSPESGALPIYVPEPEKRLRLHDLSRFIKAPVSYFFKERLQVSFDTSTSDADDVEPFDINGLVNYGFSVALLREGGILSGADEIQARLEARADKLGREGRLPIGIFGEEEKTRLVQELVPVRRKWLELCATYPEHSDKLPVEFERDGLLLEDWLDGFRADGNSLIWLSADPKNLTGGKDNLPRGDMLIQAWIRQLASAAMGQEVIGLLLGRDALITMAPLDPVLSREILDALLDCWCDGMSKPLPASPRAALAFVAGEDAQGAYDGTYSMPGEASRDPALARTWPTFSVLSAEADWPEYVRLMYAPLAAWLQSSVTVTMISEEEASAV